MKTMLITGSSRGIGAEIAKRAYLSGQYNIVINYNKSAARAARLHSEILEEARLGDDKSYGEIIVVGADVSNPQDVENMFRQAEKVFGRVDVLVNNAAISESGLFTDLSFEDWRRMIGTNLDSVFLCCRRALPSMIHKKSGKIVNISSIWGISGASCEVSYSTAKAGIIGLTKALAKEVGPSGICVNCVAPGAIDTEMNKNLSEESIRALCDETPLGRLGEPGEIADTVLFLCSGAADFITGQTISPNGGILI